MSLWFYLLPETSLVVVGFALLCVIVWSEAADNVNNHSAAIILDVVINAMVNHKISYNLYSIVMKQNGYDALMMEGLWTQVSEVDVVTIQNFLACQW